MAEKLTVAEQSEEVVPQERVVATLDLLIARWKRADRQTDSFSQGRCEGYVQAIALLLDRPHQEVYLALRGGQL